MAAATSAAQQQQDPEGAGQAPPTPFRVPAIDDQRYRLLTLGNGLQALLVSDPSADKAAAACDVRVGSMADYEEVPGVAHFTEHMLFYSRQGRDRGALFTAMCVW